MCFNIFLFYEGENLSCLLVQLHRVEFKERVSEVVRVVRHPGVAVGAGFRCTLCVPITSTTGPATTEGNVDDLCSISHLRY